MTWSAPLSSELGGFCVKTAVQVQISQICVPGWQISQIDNGFNYSIGLEKDISMSQEKKGGGGGGCYKIALLWAASLVVPGNQISDIIWRGCKCLRIFFA